MDAIQSRLEEIVRSVREHIITSSDTPWFVDRTTLKNACHIGVRDTYTSVQDYIQKGILEGDSSTPRILRLRMSDGTHFVVDYHGYTIDPTITQYFPNATRFVFRPDEKYPIKFTAPPEDVTDWILPQWQILQTFNEDASLINYNLKVPSSL